MQRLRGSDAFAIYSDTPTSPFVTYKLAIYEPTDPSDPPSLEEVKAFLLQAVGILGMRRAGLRVLRVPLDIHHPVWVEDPDFSPEDHIYQASLPKPGTEAQLCEFVSDLAEKPLNPDRPLWELWLVDGLEGGRLAVVLKIHHALADGKMIATLAAKSHTTKGGSKTRGKGAVGEPLPGKVQLVEDALLDLARSYTVDLPHYYRELKRAREGSAALPGPEGTPIAPFSAPWTILNRSGGGGRVYSYASFSLADFKALAKQFDCTLNSVLLAVCSEALKRYLDEVDESPAEDLVAAMPIGDPGKDCLATRQRRDIHNNSVAVAILPLFQTIEDFPHRVHAIARAAVTAIAAVKRSNGKRFDNFLDYLPGTFVRGMHGYLTRRTIAKKPPHANVVISNVPGPRETLYALDGRLKMVNLCSTGNLTDAGSLNITVWSYVDKLNFSFYFRKDALPEPLRLVRLVSDVVEELRRDYLSPKALKSHAAARAAASGAG